MRLQKRDERIIELINKFGCLSVIQVSRLLNGWHRKVCQRKLHAMVQADYLRRIAVPVTSTGKKPTGRQPYLFYLGERGASIVGAPLPTPKLNLKLCHQWKNNDIMIYISCSLEGTDIECELIPEHMIRVINKTDVIPDGAVILRRKEKHALFLIEVRAYQK